jgi:hypothetical protein
MIKDPRRRRRVSFGLMTAGALLLLLAPENAWVGITAVVVGVVLEAVGVRIGHSG